MGFAAENPGWKACYKEEWKVAASVVGTHGGQRQRAEFWSVGWKEHRNVPARSGPAILSRAWQISSAKEVMS